MYLLTITLMPEDREGRHDVINNGTLYGEWFFTKKAARKAAEKLVDMMAEDYGPGVKFVDIVRVFSMRTVETVFARNE